MTTPRRPGFRRHPAVRGPRARAARSAEDGWPSRTAPGPPRRDVGRDRQFLPGRPEANPPFFVERGDRGGRRLHHCRPVRTVDPMGAGRQGGRACEASRDRIMTGSDVAKIRGGVPVVKPVPPIYGGAIEVGGGDADRPGPVHDRTSRRSRLTRRSPSRRPGGSTASRCSSPGRSTRGSTRPGSPSSGSEPGGRPGGRGRPAEPQPVRPAQPPGGAGRPGGPRRVVPARTWRRSPRSASRTPGPSSPPATTASGPIRPGSSSGGRPPPSSGRCDPTCAGSASGWRSRRTPTRPPTSSST